MSSYRICRYKKSFVSKRQMVNPGEAETKLPGEAECLLGGNDGAVTAPRAGRADATQRGGYPLPAALGDLCLVPQDEQGLEFVYSVI